MDNRIPQNQIVDPRKHLREQLEKERAKRHARSSFWLFWILVERGHDAYLALYEAYLSNGFLGIAWQIQDWYEEIYFLGVLGEEATWLNRHVGNPNRFGFLLLVGVVFLICILFFLSTLG